MDQFPEFLDHKTRVQIEEQFRRREREKAKNDPWMEWRQDVNYALSDEGISAVWGLDDSTLTLTPLFGGTPESALRVPVLHMQELWGDGVPAKAIASYLKAVMFDARFKLWRVEGEEDDD